MSGFTVGVIYEQVECRVQCRVESRVECRVECRAYFTVVSLISIDLTRGTIYYNCHERVQRARVIRIS